MPGNGAPVSHGKKGSIRLDIRIILLLRVSVLPDFGFDMPKTFSVMIVVVIQNFIKIGSVVSEEIGYKHTNKLTN